MKKWRGVLSLLLPVLVLGACVTKTTYKVEPSEPGSTLLIGQINLDFTGFPNDYQINGPHGKGLLLRFVDEYGNRTSVTAYGKEALFGFEASADSYVLSSIEFSNDRVSATIDMNWACDITSGQVNNLGMVEGVWQAANNTLNLAPSGGHDALKKYFIERYPESGWNGATWTNVGFYAGR